MFSNNYQGKEYVWVDLAYQMARKTLDGRLRSDGTPFMEHPEHVAAIVSRELGLGPGAVAAVFLHEAFREHPESLESGCGDLPKEVVRMAEDLNKIAAISLQNTGLQADRYRNLMLAYSTDPQVVIIKLADRLEVMRRLDIFPKSAQIKKATETLFLYAPLAHQLGLYNLKSELENLSLKYTHPEDYRFISNKLKLTADDREAFLSHFVAPLEADLKKEGIGYQLKTRTKSVFSIWNKMQVQQVSFDEVYDLFAIRFIVTAAEQDEVALCWRVFSVVTQHYKPIPERMRDWLSRPRSNGYMSLHITVVTPEGKAVEVQIRSERMDYEAEMGAASHWSYKGVHSEKALQDWLAKVRQLLQRPDAEEMPVERFQSGDVYVFTPNGDLRQLPRGATVLDFAFGIHSNLGTHCTGGRIDGRMVPIRTRLETGQVVEILTAKNQVPSQDWLGVVITTKARNKIRQALREEEGRRIRAGRELLERRLRNWKMELEESELTELVKQFHYKAISDFYGAVGQELISPSEVKAALLDLRRASGAAVQAAPQLSAKAQEGVGKQHKNKDYLVIDERVNRIGYKLAKCCNPIPGDEVFGFVSITGGVKIHRTHCPNASRLISLYPYRIQKVRWREGVTDGLFQVQLRFTAEKEVGITQEVGEVIKDLSLDLRGMNMQLRGGVLEGRLQVAVRSNEQVNLLLMHLRRIKGMNKVNRVSNA